MLNTLLDNRVNAQGSGILNHMLYAIKEKEKKERKKNDEARFRRVLVHY